MKKIYNVLFILAVPAIFLFFTSEVLYHTGSPGGKTGSPGDGGHKCTDCHAGTSIAQDFLIYSPELLLGGYSPGMTYDMFVVGYDPNAAKYGFEATAEDNSNNKVGTFVAGFGGLNQTILNSSAITHTALGIIPMADSGTMWMFQWISPAESVGDITFYVAVNAVNGNGNNNGDQVYTSSFATSPATAIGENKQEISWSVFPNPSLGATTFKNSQGNQHSTLSLINLTGQVVFEHEVTGNELSLDFSRFEKGIYFIRFAGQTQRLILR